MRELILYKKKKTDKVTQRKLHVRGVLRGEIKKKHEFDGKFCYGLLQRLLLPLKGEKQR